MADILRYCTVYLVCNKYKLLLKEYCEFVVFDIKGSLARVARS